MKNQVTLVISGLVVLLVSIFALMNNTTVPINFGFAKISGPLIVIIIIAFILGAVATIFFSLQTLFSKNRQIRQLDEKYGDEFNQYKEDNVRLREEVKAVEERYRKTLNEVEEDLYKMKDENSKLQSELNNVSIHQEPREI
ncbi:lipopolysaccharide assembly protein LapA domain-containing protein [Granulicatella seriolae]|uniref:Lipopolysaccharide assembly protein LapA domain-containing protein n=1 Tax=Granulicatella seriolae TaxID=2967226 RepID=A0ABT1WK73_9LACT|nr:lipopolysaccharide assembly protein LapA domain-containing protein [Granulicatella seriolae]